MMKKILFLSVFTILFYSCNENEEVIDNPEAMTFEQAAERLNFQSQISLQAQPVILDKFGSVENWVNLIEEKRQEKIYTNITGRSSRWKYRVQLVNIWGPSGTGNGTFRCGDDEYILDAAEENGIEHPYSCRAGMCPTCATWRRSGSAPDQSEQSFLDDVQIAHRYVLICVAIPTGDVVLESHAESDLF